MTRLETIATRQRRSLLRDTVFAGFLVVAVALGATSVGAAITGANTHLVR